MTQKTRETRSLQESSSSPTQERYVSPERASQILAHVLGHGYSRQSVLRLLESGVLVGHQMTPRGRWWILSASVRAYAQSVLKQNEGNNVWMGGGGVNQVVTISPQMQKVI